jgi:hypothetical protein
VGLRYGNHADRLSLTTRFLRGTCHLLSNISDAVVDRVHGASANGVAV